MATLELVVAVDAENPVEGDLRLVQGTARVTSDLLTETAQKLRMKFLMAAGEWFLDPTQGIPYFTEILVKNPDRARVETIFRRTITETAGIAALDQFACTLDTITRRWSLVFRARLDDGRVLTQADLGSFIVAP